MDLIYSIISMFFLNYFVCWIMNIIGKGSFRNKLIVVSIIGILNILQSSFVYVPYFIAQPKGFETLIWPYACGIIGTLVAFYITYKLINDGSRVGILANKRAKKFDKMIKQGEDELMKQQNTIVFIVGFILSLALTIYFFVVQKGEMSDYIKLGIAGVVALVCLIAFLLTLIKKNKNYIFVLLIETEDSTLVYSSEEHNNDYKNKIDQLSKRYLIDTYGKVFLNNAEMHIVMGIKTDNIDNQLLDSLEMEMNKYSFYSNIINEFDKRHKYVFKLNDKYEIISKQEVTKLNV